MSAPIRTLPDDGSFVVETSPSITLAEIDQTRLRAVERREPSINELLHFAIAQNLPVESIERFVALSERMEARAAAKEFARAMAAFQAECPSIKKSSNATIVTNAGGSYKYTYAELDEIARTANPILAKHGLSYGWDRKVTKEGMLTSTCTLRHTNGHSVTSSFELPTESKSAMSAQQKYGAASTFADRKALQAVLGLTTTDDDPDVPAADAAPITEDQATEIADLLAEKNVDRARFLVYMGAERVADIRATDYRRALTALKRKQEKAK